MPRDTGYASSATVDPSAPAPERAVGKRTRTAQLAPRPPQASATTPGPVDALPTGGGADLDAGVAARAGATLGHDFSSVRVHQAGHADALGTRAFAYGDDLHFASGAYDPSSAGGVSLIGHELAHVAQQRQGRVSATGALGGVAVNTDPALEAAADADGARVAQGFDLDGFLDFAPRARGTIATPVAQGEDLASQGTATATEAAAPAGTRTHVVQAGEKLESIAQAHGVTVDALKAANAALVKRWTIGEGEDAKVVEGFNQGATIVIPAAPATPPSGATGTGTTTGSTTGTGTGTGETTAPPPGPGLVEGAVTAVTGAVNQVIGTVNQVIGTVTGAVDTVTDGAGKAWDFVFGSDGATVPADQVVVGDQPIAAEPTAPAPAAPAAPEGVTSNLDAAEQLASDTSVRHTDDGGLIAGEKSGGARRNEIVAGNEDELQTMKCSEFTALALAESGWDLGAQYQIDGRGVGYADPDGITFVTLYMVVNNQPEATAAILNVQKQSGTLYVKGSPEATALASSKNNKWYGKYIDDNGKEKSKVIREIPGPAAQTADFWVAGAALSDVTIEQGDQFGAGAAAVSLGGTEVAAADRRPGDIQQRFDCNSAGTTTGQGHSSTVYSVRGGGVAQLAAGSQDPRLVDASGAPVPVEGVADGWYEADGTSRMWEIGPDALPAHVASLSVTQVQLIDANVSTDNNRGSDATGIGGFKGADKSTQITSTGRLPGSPWSAGPATATDVKPAP